MKARNVVAALATILALAACTPTETTEASSQGGSTPSQGSTPVSGDREVKFDYSDATFTPDLGDKRNEETYDYDDLIVNPLTNSLRNDFAFGVDGSMINVVEANGGVYYNEDGVEQDVYQILADQGANFFRVRLWNKPYYTYTQRNYGGGDNTVERDIEMAKRAQAAGMNVCVDFHYSDFWADPDKQQTPVDWANMSFSEVCDAIQEFTRDSLNAFKDAGVNVQAVQIGNEINNGMVGDFGEIDWNDLDGSFERISSLLKSGIAGMKEAFPDAYSIIHLANGTNGDEFETYFTYLDENGVDYDIIGASYYPALAGDLSRLQDNLDNVSEVTGKPVMVVETSWGYTDDYNQYTANQYSSDDEDAGGYLTSIQAQATSLRDVLDVLSKVPGNAGLGCFYWEPAWLPVEGAGWATKYGQAYADSGTASNNSLYEDGLATWSNQGWFSYDGRILPSGQTYNAVKAGGMNATEEVSLEARTTAMTATINLAADETLPTTGKVVTNLDAIRDANVVWDETEAAGCNTVGTHTVTGKLDGKYDVTLTATCIENYVVDPGFENQGETDVLKDPWFIRSVNPDAKIVKLDRKSDTRTGRTDLNWYYSAGDFSFDFYQAITGMPEGTYELTTHLLAPAQSEFEQTLTLYIKVNGTESTFDLSTLCVGWASGYQEAKISNVSIPANAEVEIGIRGTCVARSWAHNDDWTLLRQ